MLSRKTSLSLALLAPVLVVFPGAAHACAVCFSGFGVRALRGYYVSTVMLSLLPFALIGMVMLVAYAMRNRGGADSGGRAHPNPPSGLDGRKIRPPGWGWSQPVSGAGLRNNREDEVTMKKAVGCGASSPER